ncbi:hypothetical protein [Methylobacter sp. S3L5C]|uniref:hypothetical protein n=1 Tax=Methylobacter sp. S3L5C TaxID=2839024 RepID=UPI001FACFE8B|nr:hypothetical protein [Methylobacter sp. S3L5C]UOA08328.1 hypothetical protein KKZ03_19330 [Methylobacter sp. S3L5C]
MHIRRANLESLRTQLQALPDFAGVWIQRIGPVRNSYPCITLYSESETVEYLTFQRSPRPQERTQNVSVNIWVRGTTDDEKAEIDMDNFALAVEAILSQPDKSSAMQLVATDFKVAEDEPELHVVTLTYHLNYFSTEFNLI